MYCTRHSGRRSRLRAPELTDWMHRHLSVVLGAAAAVAAFGLVACSPSEPKVSPSSSSAAVPATPTTPVASPPKVPLPAPEALTDVLSRLADPNVPAVEKVDLIEGATPESAGTLEKFTTALRDNGYLPMTFAADDIAWSDKNPSNVMATITVNTAQADNGKFTFPMEFTPSQGGWRLSRRTAEMLLALSKSPTATAPSPPPAPAPTPEPAPTPPR
jgi:hypothetical protein